MESIVMEETMGHKATQTLQDRIQRAVLTYSFRRWESLALITLTLILTATSLGLISLSFIPQWIWIATLGMGGLFEAMLVYTSLKDPKTYQLVSLKILRDEFNPKRLRQQDLRQQVEKALDYWNQIEAKLRNQRQTVLTENLGNNVIQIDHWLENIYTLARRLDGYQAEREHLTTNEAHLSHRLGQLEQQLQTTSDLKLKQQLQVTIAGMQRQLKTIAGVETTMERAYLQLEHSVVALGTIWAQLNLAATKVIDHREASKLSLGITEEVNQLDDLLFAMDEVYEAEGG